MPKITTNRAKFVQLFTEPVASYIEKNAPMLVSLINQYKGVYERHKNKTGAYYSKNNKDYPNGLIMIGSNYTFINNANVSATNPQTGKQAEDLVLTLAHELGHAVGTNQSVGISIQESVSKTPIHKDNITAQTYANVRHLGEAEAIYTEYLVAKELGKVEAWRSGDQLNNKFAEYIEAALKNKKTLTSTQKKSLFQSMVKIHKDNAVFGTQSGNVVENWTDPEVQLYYLYNERSNELFR